MLARVRCMTRLCASPARTQKRARPSDDKGVVDEDVLDIIAWVLPVVGVPEMVLEHLVGSDCLTDNDLKVLENRLGMTKEYDTAGCVRTLLGGVEHSFDDHPSCIYHSWMRNGEEHRSHGKPMDRVYGKQMYYHRGALIAWKTWPKQ
jgi:hypothetical protein